MNRNYSYGKRRPTGPDTLVAILVAMILAIISLGILYMDSKAQIEGVYEDLKSTQSDFERLKQSIDSARKEPILAKPIEKKEDQSKKFRKRIEKDTSKTPEKPKEIHVISESNDSIK